MKTDAICGLNAVSAVFACRPQAVRRLFYAAELRTQAGPFCAVLAAARRPYRMLPPDELEKAAGTAHHGGIVAIADQRPPLPWDAARPPRHRFVLALDGIGNPHNLGAIARSAAFFGADALLLAEGKTQAMPSDAAYRTAEGGLEYLSVYRPRSLATALRTMAPAYRTVAASLDPAAVAPAMIPRDKPLALVLGNEEHGIAPEVLAACGHRVRIDGSGSVQSLNVAQAGAVLLAFFLLF